jgi:glycosyltransferase involved in cell wall biosynthesis
VSAPAVSVIIPTYNRLWCLPEAIASCAGAACAVEVIVVDDGSTDGTWEWLATRDDVVALRQPNLGKDWAVATGLAAARGTFVKFLDSDDCIVPGVIDPQVELAERTGADVVASGYEMVAHDGTLIERHDFPSCDDFVAQQLGECGSSHYSAYLFRRSFVADVPHRPEYGALDDRMYVIEVAMKAPAVAVWPAPAVRLRHHGSDRMQFPSGLAHVVKHFHHLQVYRRALRRLEAAGELTPRRARAAAKMLWTLAHWIAKTHPAEAADVAAWVARLDPDFRPPEPEPLATLYRRLGFRATERLLRIRRGLLAPVRALRRADGRR